MTSFALVENVIKIDVFARICIRLNMYKKPTHLCNKFTFGPGNPCPVSPIGPGGPVGPTSPWREDKKGTMRNSGNNLSNPSNSSSALLLCIYLFILLPVNNVLFTYLWTCYGSSWLPRQAHLARNSTLTLKDSLNWQFMIILIVKQIYKRTYVCF